MSCTSSSARSGRGSPTGPGATRGSSGSSRARSTLPRWSISSSSTSCPRRRRHPPLHALESRSRSPRPSDRCDESFRSTGHCRRTPWIETATPAKRAWPPIGSASDIETATPAKPAWPPIGSASDIETATPAKPAWPPIGIASDIETATPAKPAWPPIGIASDIETATPAKPAWPPIGIASDIETATPAKPAWPPIGIASDASAARPDGGTASGASAADAERGADAGDHEAGQGHVRERADEARLEEAPAQPGERDQLEADHDRREGDRNAVVRNQERQRVQDAADEGSHARDRTPNRRAPAAGQLTRVREPLGVRHADAGRDRGRRSRDEGDVRAVGVKGDREDGRDRREGAVDQAGEGRLDPLEQEGTVGHE